MKANKSLKILFVLTALSLCLPWFTYDARMMGYCCGYDFLKWFIVPIALIALCIFYPRRIAVLILLTEVSQLGCFFILVRAFGYWQEVCNIRSGAQWLDGIHTVQPGYWVSLCFFVLLFIGFQIELFSGNEQSHQGESAEYI